MENLNDIFAKFGSTGNEESSTEKKDDVNLSKKQNLIINIITIYLVWVHPLVRVAIYSYFINTIMYYYYNVVISYEATFISYLLFEVIFFGGISRTLKNININKK